MQDYFCVFCQQKIVYKRYLYELVDLNRNFMLNILIRHNQLLQSAMQEEFNFVYKGIEYDASEYADKHPGGVGILRNMKHVKKDFTQYFRALHSNQAEKVLMSFKVIKNDEPSKDSEEYMEIYKKMEPHQEPLWSIEALLFLLVSAVWVVGCTTSYPVVSVLSFAFSQGLISWIGHSTAHSRNKKLNVLGRIESALVGGLSLDWWSPKHNMHHMFTNIQKYDQDIQHQYKVYLYPFLYLKWRFDSLVEAASNKNMIDVVLILCNYWCLYYFSQNFVCWIVGQLVSGFYIAFVLIGNHQKEIRYAENPNMSFIDHQITTSRNYKYDNFFWLLMMGGMQYQAEHHLFPQIPFYRLPYCKKIIREELSRLNKSLIFGPVI